MLDKAESEVSDLYVVRREHWLSIKVAVEAWMTSREGCE